MSFELFRIVVFISCISLYETELLSIISYDNCIGSEKDVFAMKRYLLEKVIWITKVVTIHKKTPLCF